MTNNAQEMYHERYVALQGGWGPGGVDISVT